MLSTTARNGLDILLSRSMVDAIKTTNDPEWIVKPIKDIDEVREKEFIMLTISSYLFQVIILLHFSRDEATMKYVSKALNLPESSLEDEKFYDFLGEKGNTMCGCIKRELNQYIPHLGMSTPNKLDNASLVFLKELGFEYETHVKVFDQNKIDFFGSIFVNTYKDIDFMISAINSENTEDVGELELF